MVKAVVASRNKGKIAEIREILTVPQLQLLTYEDLDGWPEFEEEGESFYENAMIKARALTGMFGLPAVADDSGLEVDALDGAPGIRSSRYAGEDATDEANNAKLLAELADTPAEMRTARFRCAAVFMLETGRSVAGEGTLEGAIGFEPKGFGGFGYDPLFSPEGYDRTLAELGHEIKNEISHRARAFHLLKQELEQVFHRDLRPS
ncbi:MAG: RdgB/HAM1 family non-canonical purine NTP pyrophosphatase [Candidatus Aquicultorales bacterium]